MKPRPEELRAPEELRRRYEAREWRLVYRNDVGTLTYRLDDAEQPRFLKLARAGGYPTLASECERLRWAADFLPVPAVVEEGAATDVEWLVTEALPGEDATHSTWLSRPHMLTRLLAQGLRQFHSAPVEHCPFDSRLESALGHARQRLTGGLIDPARDFHPEHQHLNAAEAVNRLERTRPDEEDLVVCHGDYCVPNIILHSDDVSGFVDVGELGVADRWWDLAVATWSLTWNLGAGYESEFLEAYGVEEDPERMAYYRLLYDVVS